jgi:hypothetical protein
LDEKVEHAGGSPTLSLAKVLYFIEDQYSLEVVRGDSRHDEKKFVNGSALSAVEGYVISSKYVVHLLKISNA